MKIKTITCHDVYNVGASLQAYALAKYLENIGHKVEIIDYKPDYLVHYKLTGICNPKFDKPILREIYNLLKLPGRLKARHSRRKKEFDSFTNRFLPTTARTYVSNSELKQNPPDADVFFAGSDQIWNTFFRNGKDPAFYLDFAPSKSIKASYAASFSTEYVPEEWVQPIKKWLSKMDYISVRESSGVKILEELGINGAVHVLDPVFLLDADSWSKIEKNLELDEPYLLLYDFDRNKEVADFTKRIAKENGWKIYSVLPCNYCDKCFDQEGPQAFVNLVHNAQFVVSNSFHATAFSLIFHKQFVVFNREENINTRMRDLSQLGGVSNRLINNINSTILEPIDYDGVDIALGQAIESSKAYINMVLEGIK